MSGSSLNDLWAHYHQSFKEWLNAIDVLKTTNLEKLILCVHQVLLLCAKPVGLQPALDK